MIAIVQASLAELLREKLEAHKGRRDGRDIKQADVARKANVSQSHVSRVLSGDAGLQNLTVPQQKRFLEAFHFTRQEMKRIAREYDLQALAEWLTLEEKTQATPQFEVAEGPTVPLLGSVSAGTITDSMVDDLGRVNAPHWIADRYDLADVFAVEVTGDSMTCEDAHKNIPEGSLVFFHSTLQPEHGEIICCRLEDPEISVMKVYRPKEDYVVLASYNQRHRPIVLEDQDACQLEGVYLTHIPRPRRLR